MITYNWVFHVCQIITNEFYWKQQQQKQILSCFKKSIVSYERWTPCIVAARVDTVIASLFVIVNLIDNLINTWIDIGA